jgi:ATP-dependent helicase HrpB
MFPVETRYLDRPLTGPRDTAVFQCIRRSLAQDTGSLLVFLPGMAEIRRVERALLAAKLDEHVIIAPLHGDLPQEAQDQTIAPPKPGSRKVVLATSIAETNLTIDGIRVVIDGGQVRAPRFDPGSGLTRLETLRVTQDSADQRRGRAGRLEPGICYRLWTEQEHQTLLARRPPEILEADLSPLLLETAQWGASDPSELSWLTPPPSGAVAQARDLLFQLGALDRAGRLTPHGRQMGSLSLHPRLAHMLLKSAAMDSVNLACELAALLSERDILRSAAVRQADVRLRLDLLHGSGSQVDGASVDRRILDRITRAARQMQGQLQRLAGVGSPRRPSDLDAIGLLLALAYPDRIAQRQKGGDGRYLLANGRGALFARPDPLAAHPYLVIPELDAGSPSARIDLAAPISPDEIERLYGRDTVASEAVAWDNRTGAVRASRQRRLGALVLSEEPLSQPDPLLIASALLDGVRKAGLHTLAWTPELQNWRMRVRFLRRMGQGDVSASQGRAGENPTTSTWPDVSDEHLLDTLDEWLGPFVIGMTTLDRVQRMDLSPPLHALLNPVQERDLKRLAPTHLAVPSGSHVRLDYGDEIPILAVRLQEMFGCKDTPRVLDGAAPVLLHLLSPAKRPVQVTKDLASFWANAYPEVRKELRGRYPKHHWPEDPLSAPPTAKTKRRS